MLDQSLLSDEAGIVGGEQFTGAFVSMSCNDLSGKRKHVDFDFSPTKARTTTSWRVWQQTA